MTDILAKEASVPFLKINRQKGQEGKKSSIRVTMQTQVREVFCKGCRLSLMFNNSESAADWVGGIRGSERDRG